MHDRAAEPMGAAASVTAATSEIMILLRIEVRIAQVTLSVEEKRSELFHIYSRAFSTGMAGNLHYLRIFFVGNFFKPFAIMTIIIPYSTIRILVRKVTISCPYKK